MKIRIDAQFVFDTDTGLLITDPDSFSWATDSFDIVNDIQESSSGDWVSISLHAVQQLVGVPPGDVPTL